ncbi:MAG TPA: LPS export ABC transporter periplasmic protein LptC [Gammaproteobacteria bacterium]|nr:LPS export ABC transporter periplasmic protein LptC [Gammaproteobacteria bacterium]HAU06235.1 LPS export ABC transporter periplasmic protein LptC [Gammaproteobacteria bacterium]
MPKTRWLIKLNVIIPSNAVLVLLTLFWLNWPHLSYANPVSEQQLTDSDYSITDFTMILMDKLGQPQQIISGHQIIYYLEHDITHISLPIAEFISPDQQNWIITAEKGQTDNQGTRILLEQNVVIRNKDNSGTTLYTTSLILDTEKKIAYTDAPVTQVSPYGETHATGLHATLIDRTINLHSKVKGKYDAPSTIPSL